MSIYIDTTLASYRGCKLFGTMLDVVPFFSLSFPYSLSSCSSNELNELLLLKRLTVYIQRAICWSWYAMRRSVSNNNGSAEANISERYRMFVEI